MKKLAKALLLFPIIVFLLSGCTQPLEDGLPGSESDNSTYHSTGWKDNPQHGNDFSTSPQDCKACHGGDLKGGSSNVSCADCHHNEETANFHHGGTVTHIVPGQCDGCHGEDFSGGYTSTSCFVCHNNRDSCSACHKLLQSHPVHTVENSKGPSPLACEACHDVNPLNYTQFADGNDQNNTAVCDNCHSSGGAIDGVHMAKANWDNGVYGADGTTLKSGKEKWCVGCHDDDPDTAGTNESAVIDGVYAPGIAGDNISYGFYASGHGRAESVKCLDCHDASVTHTDGEARTYAFNSAYYAPDQSGVAYAAGYRLKYVGEDVPLMIPTNYNITFGYDAGLMKNTAFRLCFSCHDSDKILDDTPGCSPSPCSGIDCNFKASIPNPPRNYSYAWGSGADTNEHVAHIMNYTGPHWDSDWDTNTTGPGGSNGRDSLTACSTCHNVHGAVGAEGSTNEGMVRDGSLAGRTGYGFSYVIEDTSVGGYPWVTSDGATQASGVGAIFRNNTDNMCGGSTCHGNPDPPSGSSYDATGSSWGTYLEYYRPWTDNGHLLP